MQQDVNVLPWFSGLAILFGFSINCKSRRRDLRNLRVDCHAEQGIDKLQDAMRGWRQW
jgi:hypothetical protein